MSLVCADCHARYPTRDDIIDLVPQKVSASGANGARHYRTESLYDVIARWYDVGAAPMAAAVWRCSPLRYVDWAHRCVGRATGGRLLVNPVGTGILLSHVHSIHIDFPIVAVDVSWNMLKRARRRLSKRGIENVTLVRAEPTALPFTDGAFRAVMSMNGVNGFHDRRASLSELHRVTESGGWITGSALCRGLQRTADFMLARYEKWGVYPILRSREFLIRELREAFGVEQIDFETYGAAVFFLTQLSRQEEAIERQISSS